MPSRARRLWQAAHSTCHGTGKDASGRQLHRELQSYLLEASDQRLVLEPPAVIRKPLDFMGPDADGYFDLTVGTVRSFNRTKISHISRARTVAGLRGRAGTDPEEKIAPGSISLPGRRSVGLSEALLWVELSTG
ncbi:hypothetical protein [Sorangium sp. So ce233]|uniref:hypothetical protein n=1 Tax=Sorangium sp. So ce233 TaxID=3133290 RepID=UPI003F5D99F6